MSESQTTSRPVVAFLTIRHNKGNPYTGNLCDAIEHAGFTVEGTGFRTVFLQHMPRGTRILHIHWLGALVTAPSRLKTLFKFVVFFAQLLWVRMRGVRVVWTVHNLLNHERHNRALDLLASRLVARWSSAVFVHCGYARDEAIRLFKIGRPSKVVVTEHPSYVGSQPNTISRADARRELGLGEADRVALFLGVIRPYKGVLDLIEAFKKINRPDGRLLIAGKIREMTEAELRERIADDPRILLHPGFVADERVQVFMNASDVVALPYRDMLTSGSALLAMSFGKAVVGPRIGCMPEQVGPDCGVLYDAEDADGLRGSLQRAIDDADATARMGASAMARAKALTWERMGDEVARVYRQVLGD
ncbi:MAG: glycosyltransferase family 4 protein [Salinibacterium sp.]|nr:glycosyltransferase family 4 protein [Salinibacterium sp.]